MVFHNLTSTSVTDIVNLVTRLSIATNIATDVLVTTPPTVSKVTNFHLPRQAVLL